jgi:hypothetical protein
MYLSKFSTKIKLLYIKKKMANPLARILRAKPCFRMAWLPAIDFHILIRKNRVEITYRSEVKL